MRLILAKRREGLLAEIFSGVNGQALDRHFHVQMRLVRDLHERRVTNLTQKLTLDADEARLDAILDEAERIIKKIEPDCVLVR